MLKDYLNARPDLKLAYEKMPRKYKIDLNANNFVYPDLTVFDPEVAGFDIPDGG